MRFIPRNWGCSTYKNQSKQYTLVKWGGDYMIITVDTINTFAKLQHPFMTTNTPQTNRTLSQHKGNTWKNHSLYFNSERLKSGKS